MISKEDIGMITQDYRLAKDKEEQITIMAQLYGTDTADIRGILFRAGAYKIGRAEVLKALGILQKGGKNHGLGGLRLFMSAFKDCSAKDARRILIDYMNRPWEEEIPVGEFKRALKLEIKTVKIGNGEAKMIFEGNDSGMAAGPEPELEKPAEKTDVAPKFSAEEQKLIIYGLTRLYVEKDQEWRKMKENADEKKRKLEEAEAEYKAAKEAEDLAAASMADLEALIGRIQAEEPEQKADDLSEQLWDIMANNKQQ